VNADWHVSGGSGRSYRTTAGIRCIELDVFILGETVGYVPMQAKARLVVLPTTGSRYLLKGSSVQLRIEQPATSSGRFEVLAVFLLYLPGGHLRHAPIT